MNNTRLLGAVTIVALVVLFVPMFFSRNPPAKWTGHSVSLTIPPFEDDDFETRTLPLAADNRSNARMMAGSVDAAKPRPDPIPGALNPGHTPGSSSLKPGQKGAKATPARAGLVMPSSVVSHHPDRKKVRSGTGSMTTTSARRVTSHARSSKTAMTSLSVTRSDTCYTLNLSAYSKVGAQHLMARVRAMGYSVRSQSVERDGRALIMVTAGLFTTRAAAEVARLRIVQSIRDVPARLERITHASRSPVPTGASVDHDKAGGWVVQVAAMAHARAAHHLRDTLRKAGFDGFVDGVDVQGRYLWRVRVGPTIRRKDALHVRRQIRATLGLPGQVIQVP